MSDPIPTPTPTPAPEAPTELIEPQPEAPKPTETVDFWKQQARANEARAKANAEAAQRLQAIEDAQKTEAQKQADATAKAQREADDARAEALRYKVAATHRVGEDYFDLLGTGDEETMTGRAQRISGLIAAQAENEQLKAEIAALRAGKPSPAPIRPVADLKPGATPDNQPSERDVIYQSLFGN